MNCDWKLRAERAIALRAPKPTQYIRGHNGDAGSGRNASESLFCSGLTMSETVPADHNGNQGCDLRNGSGEKVLEVGEATVERRTRLCIGR